MNLAFPTILLLALESIILYSSAAVVTNLLVGPEKEVILRVGSSK